MASLAAAEQVSKGNRQHGGLLVAHAMHTAPFGHLPMEGLPKAQQLIAGHRAGPVFLLLMFLKTLGQPALAQLARRLFDQIPHVKRLGSLVGFVEILRDPVEA